MGDLVHGFWPFWGILGYAEKYLGAAGVLAGQFWEASELFDLESCLMWCIWRECNRRSFEDCEQSYIKIKLFFLRSLFDWGVGWDSHSCSSLFQFLELCSLRVP
jgi:hypothetical protein